MPSRIFTRRSCSRKNHFLASATAHPLRPPSALPLAEGTVAKAWLTLTLPVIYFPVCKNVMITQNLCKMSGRSTLRKPWLLPVLRPPPFSSTIPPPSISSLFSLPTLFPAHSVALSLLRRRRLVRVRCPTPFKRVRLPCAALLLVSFRSLSRLRLRSSPPPRTR